MYLNLQSPTRASRDCVLCRAFGTGDKKDTCEQECSDFNLIVVKDKLPEPNDASYPVMHCKERDANDCWFYYTYAVNNNTQTEVHVLDKLGRPGLQSGRGGIRLRRATLMTGPVVAALQK